MKDNILTKTRTGFASVPNKFLRDKNISIESKGTASFLQSLPHGWVIHPKWVKHELGYGERVWLRVAKELIEYGCLKLIRGGKDKGCTYVFDLWNYEENYLKSDNDKMSTSTKCGNDKMSLSINKDNKQKKNNIKNNNNNGAVDNSKIQLQKQTACGAVILKTIDEKIYGNRTGTFIKLMEIPGFSERNSRDVMNQYPEYMINEALESLKNNLGSIKKTKPHYLMGTLKKIKERSTS